MRENIELIKCSRKILAEIIVESSYSYAISRSNNKKEAFKVMVDNQIYLSELLAKDRLAKKIDNPKETPNETEK
jgi:uncharacterized protein (UPF0128 family)